MYVDMFSCPFIVSSLCECANMLTMLKVQYGLYGLNDLKHMKVCYKNYTVRKMHKTEFHFVLHKLMCFPEFPL